MKDWLNKPFPIIETVKQKFLTALLFAMFVYIFLLIFQPFGIAETKTFKPLYISGYFLITFLVMLFNFFFFIFVFKKIFVPDNWLVKKQITFEMWNMLMIAFFNWLYTLITSYDNIVPSLISFLFFTISVGIFPIIFYTMYAEKYLTKKHQLIAENLTDKIKTPFKKDNQQINIVSDNKKDNIVLDLQKFICVRSEGNYANVFYFENDNVKKKLIRSTLLKISEQLIIFDSIKRCHRSYIVNLQNVDKVGGNARNYNFYIEKLDFTIPVSRSFPKSIIKDLK